MKNSLVILFIIINLYGVSQNPETIKAFKILETRGEVVMKFKIKNPLEINLLSDIISIDEQTKPGSNLIFAYANKKQFQKFLKLNIAFEVLVAPGDIVKNPKMLISKSVNSYSWDAYPTYQTYINMMSQFQTDFPDLCSVFHIGNSVQNRQIIFARLTSNLNSGQLKPRVMLTSTMHGDEPVGYVTLLRMIDYLLTNYSNISKITNLLDNYEIWINPLANPDGTFAGGNNTISGATRFNANSIDLNRNFPDFDYGLHPDGNDWQPENNAMMHLTDSLHYIVSVNIHSGSETVNYPWDTKQQRHSDDNWWQYVAKNYADTVFSNSIGGYFTYPFSTGYTNGSDWYIIHGGRQDYMNYYKNCREFTLEISVIKIPDGSDLPMYWEANYRSLINYIQEASLGFNGIVNDSASGIPLFAKILIYGHDADNSNVFSELPDGNYYRPIYPGNYMVSFTSAGYNTKTIPVNISWNSALSINVQLSMENSSVENIGKDKDFDIFPNPVSDLMYLTYNGENKSELKIILINLQGISFNINEKYITKEIIEYNLSVLPRGIYFLKVTQQHQTITKKIALN